MVISEEKSPWASFLLWCPEKAAWYRTSQSAAYPITAAETREVLPDTLSPNQLQKHSSLNEVKEPWTWCFPLRKSFLSTIYMTGTSILCYDNFITGSSFIYLFNLIFPPWLKTEHWLKIMRRHHSQSHCYLSCLRQGIKPVDMLTFSLVNVAVGSIWKTEIYIARKKGANCCSEFKSFPSCNTAREWSRTTAVGKSYSERQDVGLEILKVKWLIKSKSKAKQKCCNRREGYKWVKSLDNYKLLTGSEDLSRSTLSH